MDNPKFFTIIPKRALVIVAHPDDIEYFCGGTLTKWIQAGCFVSCLITTSGEKGSSQPNEDTNSVIRKREEEQKAGTLLLGIEDIIFLHYPDGELKFINHRELLGQYVYHMRRTQAEIILTHDPFVRFKRQHPDHRVVGQLALDASFPISGVAQCFPEHIQAGLHPFQPKFTLLFGSDQPNAAVDISETLNNKIKALEQHLSQVNSFAGGIEKRLRWKANVTGSAYGLIAAEEFLVVKVDAAIPQK